MKPTVPAALLKRRSDSHKGDYGHVLVVAGSLGLTGAAALCAEAALRTGSGLVTLAVPESVYPVLASKLTEVMVHPLPEGKGGALGVRSIDRLAPLIAQADVLAAGPGVSREPEALAAVRRLVLGTELPVVLDADGVVAFAGSARSTLRKAAGPVILTPHPGEMAMLLGKTVAAVQQNRLRTAAAAAKELRSTVVLKGHRTVVASPSGKTVVNSTGNPGMAAGGMGDVLTGMIASLIGQGLSPFEAAAAGVYLHGLAGDLAAKEIGPVGFLAGELSVRIPGALRKANSE